jgi:hypothetical protein
MPLTSLRRCVNRPTALTAVFVLSCSSYVQTQKPSVSPVQNDAPLAQNTRSGCEVRTLSQEPLFIDKTTQLYVEPYLAERSAGGDVLLIGTRNYLFREAANGKWAAVPRDSILGAVMSRSGVSLVRSPIPNRLLASPRARALADGTWAVVFAETESYVGDDVPSTAVRLWFGILAGASWKRFEAIPLPVGLRPTHYNSSELLERNGDLVWALETRNNEGYQDGVVLFHKQRGSWSSEILPVRGARYPHLAYSRSGSLLLGLAHPDTTLSFDRNSLFIWAKARTWARQVKIAPSAEGRVHDVALVVKNDSTIVSWHADVVAAGPGRRELRALVGDLDVSKARRITIDSSVTSFPSARFVQLTDHSRLWVVDHVSINAAREVRFIRETSAGVELLRSFPNRSLSRSPVISVGNDTVLQVSGIVDRERGVLATIVSKFEIRCR